VRKPAQEALQESSWGRDRNDSPADFEMSDESYIEAQLLERVKRESMQVCLDSCDIV
jgi:hypothetical protein